MSGPTIALRAALSAHLPPVLSSSQKSWAPSIGWPWLLLGRPAHSRRAALADQAACQRAVCPARGSRSSALVECNRHVAIRQIRQFDTRFRPVRATPSLCRISRGQPIDDVAAWAVIAVQQHEPFIRTLDALLRVGRVSQLIAAVAPAFWSLPSIFQFWGDCAIVPRVSAGLTHALNPALPPSKPRSIEHITVRRASACCAIPVLSCPALLRPQKNCIVRVRSWHHGRIARTLR